MKYIPFKFMESRSGQAMLEYALVFAAIVLITLFANSAIQRIRSAAEGHREQAVQRILNP